MSNANWWADRMGTPRPPAPPQQPMAPMPQQYQQPYPPQPYPPQYQQQPYPPQAYPPQNYPPQPQPFGYPPTNPQVGQQFQQPWQQQEYVPTRVPDSMKSTSRCPECNSGNYSMRGKINTMNGPVENWQCYNCGYPVKQTTSGMAGFSTPGSTNGKATPALQIPTGGFNPQGIIGHINSL